MELLALRNATPKTQTGCVTYAILNAEMSGKVALMTLYSIARHFGRHTARV